MAENENGQERTEEATPKRREESRKKGQVPRSRELNSLAMMLGGAGGMLALGGDMIGGISELVTRGLALERKLIFDKPAMLDHTAGFISDAFVLVLPFFVLMIVVALGASVALGGMSFSVEAMAFKLEKLNPLKGLKRIFALRGLVELSKALAKFFIIGGVAAFLLWDLMPQFLGLGYETPTAAMIHAGQLLGWSFVFLAASLVVIAAVDVPYQLWDHSKQLRMTRQQVKDEHKETEGKPEVKGRIRNLQREIAQRRMMAEVPKADVVVTNPTHFAVALRYEENGARAPIVVAKGADLIAAQIRSIASASDVAIFEAPPLARAIFYSTELEEEIPGTLYLAVAQVLAYVYQVRTARKQGGDEPLRPQDLPVPDEMTEGPRGHSEQGPLH